MERSTKGIGRRGGREMYKGREEGDEGNRRRERDENEANTTCKRFAGHESSVTSILHVSALQVIAVGFNLFHAAECGPLTHAYLGGGPQRPRNQTITHGPVNMDNTA